MKDLNKELFRLRVEFDFIQRVYCSKDEEKHLKQLVKNKQVLPEMAPTISMSKPIYLMRIRMNYYYIGRLNA